MDTVYCFQKRLSGHFVAQLGHIAFTQEMEKNAKNEEEEEQYLGLVRTIIAKGALRGDRTGTGTISVFGVQSRYSLRDG